MHARATQLLQATLAFAAISSPVVATAPAAPTATGAFAVRGALPETSGVVDWMKNPPPTGVSSVFIKGDNESVGVIMPDGVKAGDTVSATTVIVPRGAATETSGVVELKTPDGKKHSAKNGDVITFVAAAGAIALLASDHSSVAVKADLPLSGAAKQVAAPRPGPVLVQNNCAVNLPIPTDGQASTTSVKIGGQPSRLVAARPGEAIVVPQNLEDQTGSVPIEAVCNGQTTSLQGWAMRSTLTSPPRMRVGERSKAKLTVFLGQGPDSALLAREGLTARLTNNTPSIVSLGGKISQTFPVDARRVKPDGTCEIDVPFTALTPGTYVISASIRSDKTTEGCMLTCTGCEGSHYLTHYAYCNDAGTVNCYGGKGQACGGSCGGHRAVGGPCGFWLCACSWGKCHCK